MRRPNGAILVNIQVKQKRSTIMYVTVAVCFSLHFPMPFACVVYDVCCPVRYGETVCCFRSVGSVDSSTENSVNTDNNVCR